jgi:hypothetical protein
VSVLPLPSDKVDRATIITPCAVSAFRTRGRAYRDFHGSDERNCLWAWRLGYSAQKPGRPRSGHLGMFTFQLDVASVSSVEATESQSESEPQGW